MGFSEGVNHIQFLVNWNFDQQNDFEMGWHLHCELGQCIKSISIVYLDD
jgi:hypothetical protein